ncbi:MAG: uncharacterized protein PWP57_609 [Candidatus Atribacteria bacterium]|nr:uncharacterized protein [Candidatus Atribacteria bacterium]
MSKKIEFSFPEKGVTIVAELNNSSLSEEIFRILPVEAQINRWGKEIYFTIPLRSSIISPQEVVEEGDIAYWPDGACLCIFFGPTPVSRGKEIRPASAVEVVGKVSPSWDVLNEIPDGSIVKVSQFDRKGVDRQ